VTELFDHPQYIERAPFYRNFRDLYEGIHAVLRQPEYLWPHELETGDTDAAIRLRGIREMRTRYDNEVEPVISRYTSIFFKDDPVIGEETLKLFGDDFRNVNGSGKTFITFLKEDVLLNLLLYGRPIVITDSYDLGLRNLADQKQQNARPYFECLSPLDVKDWDLDKDGRFNFLRCEYTMVEPRTDARSAPKLSLFCKEFVKTGANSYDAIIYKGKKRDPQRTEQVRADEEKRKAMQEQQSFLSACDWQQINSVTIEAPYLPIRSMEGHESWIKDTAQLALKLYNKQSARDSIHYYQGHQRVFIKGVQSDEQRKALAEYTIGFLPADGDAFTLEPASTDSLDADIRQIKEDIRRAAFNQSRGVSTDSKQVEGQGTQQEAKEGLVSLIKSELEALENLAKDIVRDYAYFKTGNKDFEPEIVFNKDIQTEDIDKQISIYTALRGDITRCPTWYQETLKKFANYQDLEESEEIAKEIEALKPMQPQDIGARPNPIEAALNGRGSQVQKTPSGNGYAGGAVSGAATKNT
jgi:hypothetical protein